MTSVTLNGSFEPQGEATSYYFEWGKNAAYGNSVPVGPPGVSSGDSTGVETVEAPNSPAWKPASPTTTGSSP